MINNFDDEYMFLSNFFELKTPITVDGLVFRTNEHFFQAYKTLNERDRIWIANQATPGAAKKAGNKGGIGRKIKLRDDWNIIKKLPQRFWLKIIGGMIIFGEIVRVDNVLI